MRNHMMQVKRKGIIEPDSDRICYLFAREITVYGNCEYIGFYSALVPLSYGVMKYFQDWINRGIELGKR